MQSALDLALEDRDTEIAISQWKTKAEQFRKPPPISEFKLNDFGGDCFRFLILADLLVTDGSVFLAYGSGLAKRLGLPERPSIFVPMLKSIPERYRFLFAEGCSEAIAQTAPLRFNGEIVDAGCSELYRACFMPLKMGVETMQAIYGSFNFRSRVAEQLGEQHQHSDTGEQQTPAGAFSMPMRFETRSRETVLDDLTKRSANSR
jgi:hypothetical protein